MDIIVDIMGVARQDEHSPCRQENKGRQRIASEGRRNEST